MRGVECLPGEAGATVHVGETVSTSRTTRTSRRARRGSSRRRWWSWPTTPTASANGDETLIAGYERWAHAWRGWSDIESQSCLAFRQRPVTVRVQVCTGNEEVGGGSDKQRDEVLQHRHG